MKNLQIKVVYSDDKDLMALINELDEEYERYFLWETITLQN